MDSAAESSQIALSILVLFSISAYHCSCHFASTNRFLRHQPIQSPPTLPEIIPDTSSVRQALSPNNDVGFANYRSDPSHRQSRYPFSYQNYAPIWHEYGHRWEPYGYNSTDEDIDIIDDFNGRSAVAPGQYPHMAAIGFRLTDSREFVFKCGGSLISDIFVLTAAHCCHYNGQSPHVVKLGDTNLDQLNWDLITQRREVYQLYIYPEYKSPQHYHDIALIELNSPIEYTAFVRPIRLWASEEIPYEKVFTMGYGSTSFGKAPTNILTELDLSIVPFDDCNITMPLDDSSPLGIISSQICAKDFQKNRDTCQGDSGGSLQLNLERRRRRHRLNRRKRPRYYLLGIISYGEICRGRLPGIYTRVSSYIDWITSLVWPDYYQKLFFRPYRI